MQRAKLGAKSPFLFLLFLLFLFWCQVASATPVSTTHNISFVSTPGTASGDVVAAGGALFVGVGDFGVAQQSVVRIDSGGTTVLADGFNSLGGFAYDATNDRLLVGDNGGNGPGATTGDTLYGISNPFGAPGTPASAGSLELLASGAIPGFADVILDPSDPTGDTVFLSDASGSFPPNGVIVSAVLSTGVITTLQVGLEFSAGLATDGTSLFFGDSLLGGDGDLFSVPITSPNDPRLLITNLPDGVFDIEVAPDGSLIVASGGAILRVDPTTGATTEIASGFGFTGSLFAGDDGTIYALDGFASAGEADRIWVLTPVPEPSTALLVGLGLVALSRRRAARTTPER